MRAESAPLDRSAHRFVGRTRAVARALLKTGSIGRDLVSSDGLRILCYHDIADRRGTFVDEFSVPPDELRRQMIALKRLGFRFIHPHEALQFLRGISGIPARSLLLTFDDGYASHASHAVEIVRELSIPAIMFIVTKHLGGTNEWDEAAGAPRLELMTVDDVLKIQRAGVIVGAHTRTHPALPTLTDEELAAEIAGSLKDLRAIGVQGPALLAFPYGKFCRRSVAAAKVAGFEFAFTTESEVARRSSHPHRVPRITGFRIGAGREFLKRMLWEPRLGR